MGKILQFEISLLENPSLKYYPGQCVEGIVRIRLLDAMKFRGLSVTIRGESQVEWVENHSQGSSGRHTVTYSNYESNLKERVILYGSGSETSGNKVELAAGSHEFPFKFHLPQNIPQSFKDDYGSIDYSVKAVIDKELALDDKRVVKFQVIKPMNLNNIPDAQMPVQKSATKHFCCWCCKSGPLSAMVRLDRKGYTPGQKIPISAEITNLTDRDIDKSKVSIEKNVLYHSTTKTRTCTSKIASLERGSIRQGESDIWNGELLHIPPTPPSNLDFCNIIDIQYTLNFSVCCSGAMDLEIPLDILIGT